MPRPGVAPQSLRTHFPETEHSGRHQVVGDHYRLSVTSPEVALCGAQIDKDAPAERGRATCMFCQTIRALSPKEIPPLTLVSWANGVMA